MKEYIDREAAMETIKNHKCKSKVVYSIEEALYCVGQEIGEAIRSVPAADVVEVRHGLWERVIPTKSAAKWSTKVSCSQCHGQGYERYNYCPHCGALMDKEEHNEL